MSQKCHLAARLANCSVGCIEHSTVTQQKATEPGDRAGKRAMRRS